MKVLHKPTRKRLVQLLNQNEDAIFYVESRLNNHNSFDLPTSDDLEIEQDYANMKFQLLINDLIKTQ